MPDHARSASPGNSPRRQGQVYRVRNQEVVVPDGHIAVGHIVNVHGLRGEIKMEPYTDFPERFAPGERLLLGVDLVEVEIESVRPHKKFLLLRLAGVTDRTAADRLRGQWLFIGEEDIAELEEGVFWIHDIIGLRVEEETGNQLGEVVDVLATGANEVYVVRPHAGQNRGQDILLPVIPEVIVAVDVAGGVMTVRLIDGLVNPEAAD